MSTLARCRNTQPDHDVHEQPKPPVEGELVPPKRGHLHERPRASQEASLSSAYHSSNCLVRLTVRLCTERTSRPPAPAASGCHHPLPALANRRLRRAPLRWQFLATLDAHVAPGVRAHCWNSRPARMKPTRLRLDSGSLPHEDCPLADGTAPMKKPCHRPGTASYDAVSS
jgi:hypothetical protein